MPYYDYKCTKCGSIHEIQKGMNEMVESKCQKCGSALQRVFYAPRTKRSDKDIMNIAGKEQSSSCTTCSSGVCSTCGVNK